MAVKFPLKMADGTMVRTLEDLREHFDLTTVLSYYDNGRLTKWLENGYYDEEAKKVSALDADSDDFAKDLCSILGVDYSTSEAKQVDLGDISKQNERLERLKEYTADDAILAAIDRVAFTQEEFVDLLNKGITDVYLIDAEFVVPEGFEEITYQCVNGAVVKFSKIAGLEKAAGQGDTKAQMELGRYYEEKNDLDSAFRWYARAINQGDEEALTLLSRFDDDRLDSLVRGPKVVEWYTNAAMQGNLQAQMKLASFYFTKDYWEAIKWYKIAAKQGYAPAQLALGNHYYRRDKEEKAVKWYRRAAEQGYAPAQLELGDCYLIGSGIEKDKEEAIKWYRSAEEKGCAEAQYDLGDCYLNGWGVEIDREEAIKWYRKAAEQGFTLAQEELHKCEEFDRLYQRATVQGDIESKIKLADCYCFGWGVMEDEYAAEELYRELAEQGYEEAQVKLGDFYRNDDHEVDYEQAVKWYKLAAQKGYAPALLKLGDYYYQDEEDEKEAVKWYKIAAEQNYAPAQAKLGECYLKGWGVKANKEEAIKWYKRAAEQGYVPAQIELGNHYFNGQNIEVDKEEAVKWYRKAAKEDSYAQYMLGECYLHGWGVEVDKEEAVKWYEMAAEEGHSDAQDALDRLLEEIY